MFEEHVVSKPALHWRCWKINTIPWWCMAKPSDSVGSSLELLGSIRLFLNLLSPTFEILFGWFFAAQHLLHFFEELFDWCNMVQQDFAKIFCKLKTRQCDAGCSGYTSLLQCKFHHLSQNLLGSAWFDLLSILLRCVRTRFLLLRHLQAQSQRVAMWITKGVKLEWQNIFFLVCFQHLAFPRESKIALVPAADAAVIDGIAPGLIKPSSDVKAESNSESTDACALSFVVSDVLSFCVTFLGAGM